MHRMTISNDNGRGPGMAIKIKFAIIAAIFDYNPKLLDTKKLDSWEKCMAGVDFLLDMIEEHEIVVMAGELIRITSR
jgi:translation initiation factor 3 subunit C